MVIEVMNRSRLVDFRLARLLIEPIVKNPQVLKVNIAVFVLSFRPMKAFLQVVLLNLEMIMLIFWLMKLILAKVGLVN